MSVKDFARGWTSDDNGDSTQSTQRTLRKPENGVTANGDGFAIEITKVAKNAGTTKE